MGLCRELDKVLAMPLWGLDLVPSAHMKGSGGGGTLKGYSCSLSSGEAEAAGSSTTGSQASPICIAPGKRAGSENKAVGSRGMTFDANLWFLHAWAHASIHIYRSTDVHTQSMLESVSQRTNQAGKCFSTVWLTGNDQGECQHHSESRRPALNQIPKERTANVPYSGDRCSKNIRSLDVKMKTCSVPVPDSPSAAKP